MRKLDSIKVYESAATWSGPEDVPPEALKHYKDKNNRPSFWAHDLDDDRKKKALLTLALNRPKLEKLVTAIVPVNDLGPSLRSRFSYSYGDSPLRDYNKHHYELVNSDQAMLREVIYTARNAVQQLKRQDVDDLISEAYKQHWFELDALRTDDLRRSVQQVLAKKGVALR